MTTSELKSIIQKRVENIEDEHFLEALNVIIEAKVSSDPEPALTEWQKERIEESRQQIKEGKFYTDEEANKMVDKWFEGK